MSWIILNQIKTTSLLRLIESKRIVSYRIIQAAGPCRIIQAAGPYRIIQAAGPCRIIQAAGQQLAFGVD